MRKWVFGNRTLDWHQPTCGTLQRTGRDKGNILYRSHGVRPSSGQASRIRCPTIGDADEQQIRLLQTNPSTLRTGLVPAIPRATAT